MISTARRSGYLIVVLMFAVATPASAAQPPASDPMLTSIPLYARLARERVPLRSYQAAVHMSGSMHTFIFSIPFYREGTVTFERPRTWPSRYRLVCTSSASAAGTSYELDGAPIDPSSQVVRMVVHFDAVGGPIAATWTLRDGWSVSATIQMKTVDSYLLPAEQIGEITGHGYRIHTDMVFADYVLNQNDATNAPLSR